MCRSGAGVKIDVINCSICEETTIELRRTDSIFYFVVMAYLIA